MVCGTLDRYLRRAEWTLPLAKVFGIRVLAAAATMRYETRSLAPLDVFLAAGPFSEYG